MMRSSFPALLLTMSLGLFSALAVPVAAAEDVRVTGCLIKADGEDDALLVTTLTRMDAPPYTADGRAGDRRAPAYMRVVYWLDDDDDELEGHQGRLIEVRGDVEGDVDRGEIKVERDDDRVDVEFKVDGDRRLTARLPLMASGPVGTSGRDGDDEREYDVIVRKLDVEEVRMIAPTCDSSVR